MKHLLCSALALAISATPAFSQRVPALPSESRDR
jgi:hypothetical protein